MINERMLLQKLVQVSNNSQLTNIVLQTLVKKFDEQEIREFYEWLKIVEREK